MSRIAILARREFRGYFDHPTAYILVVAFLALALFFAFRSLYAGGVATLRGMFSLLPWLLVVFVPAITMRSFAEEKRSGTLEWLVAQPVTELDVVLGKFLGNWLFALTALAGTLPAALGVWLVSEADPGIMVAQYIGAGLLTGQLVAIGLFASSATRNQITAFILALAINFVLVLVGLPVVTLGLPPLLADAAQRLSLLDHFEAVARGVVDLRDVLYFASMAGLFLVLGYLLVAGERLSPARGALRRLRLGTATLAVGVLALNLLGARIHGRLDLTRGNLYTLSRGTEQVLEGLDDVVTIKLVVSKELPPEVMITLRDVRDLLADFRSAADGRLRIEELHPDRDTTAASEASGLGIQPIQFNVLRGDEFQVKRGWLGLAVLYADKREVIPLIDRTDDLEYRLTSMISALTRERKPRLAFLSGFNARAIWEYETFREMIEQQYDVRAVDIEADSAATLSPDSFDVAVLAAPTRPLNEAALDRLRSYLNAGGAALLLVDGTQLNPQMPLTEAVQTGLEPLLDEYGVRLVPALAYDLRSNERVSLGRQGFFSVVTSYPYWPIVPRAEEEHTLTRGLTALTLAWATPLEITDSTRVRTLFHTTEFGGRQSAGGIVSPDVPIEPDPSELAVQVMAVAVEPRAAADQGGSAEAGDGEPATRGRLVIVGDADFLLDRFVRSNPQNLAFAANAVDWLAQDEALISIRAKNRTPPPLVLESDFTRAALKWGNLVGVPLLFVAWGTSRVLRRRRLGSRRWQEELAV
ncbi:MAG TPA: Gldg family protein [Longimicrobiales bacterium]